jgi:hypothetical protein
MPGRASSAGIDSGIRVVHGVINNNASEAGNGPRFEKQEAGLTMSSLICLP